MRKFLRAAALVASSMLGAAPALAAYPDHPITIVVPVAAGGTVDLLARIVAKGLEEKLGQPVIVENKAGASGAIGTRYVAKSKPDGYTLLAVANTFVSVPEFLPGAGYDALKDFAPITQTCSIPMVLVTPPGRPEHTVQAFIERARKRSGSATMGSSGLGSTGYIAAELFGAQAKVKFLHVYYKGNSQALLDVMSGRLDGMFDQVSTSGPNVKNHRLQALAVTTKTRSSMLPDVPTLNEAGLPGFEDETFNAILAPAGTPAPIVAKLHDAIAGTLNQPQVRERLAQQGIEAKASVSPAAFRSYLQAYLEKYRRIAAGIHGK